MTVQELFELSLRVLAVVGAISAGFYAIFQLLTLSKTFREWCKARREYTEALKRIAEKDQEITGMSERIGAIETNLKTVQEVTTHTCEMAEKTKMHNQRQDRQIAHSLKERELIAQGVSALLDWAIANGANGTAHRAKDALRVFQFEQAHKFEGEGQ